MNRRSETRFQVYSRAQLTVLDQPDRELNVSLTDMSGAGFQLLVDEPLRPGKMIVVETDAHMMLAEVRNSRRRGERYAVGAQRVHTFSKLDLPDEADRIERVRILVDDYELKLPKQPATVKVETEGPAEIVDIFEPRPSVVFHSIPQPANPLFPKLMAAPSGKIRIAQDGD